jgi:hypothetical protein
MCGIFHQNTPRSDRLLALRNVLRRATKDAVRHARELMEIDHATKPIAEHPVIKIARDLRATHAVRRLLHASAIAVELDQAEDDRRATRMDDVTSATSEAPACGAG